MHKTGPYGESGKVQEIQVGAPAAAKTRYIRKSAAVVESTRVAAPTAVENAVKAGKEKAKKVRPMTAKGTKVARRGSAGAVAGRSSAGRVVASRRSIAPSTSVGGGLKEPALVSLGSKKMSLRKLNTTNNTQTNSKAVLEKAITPAEPSKVSKMLQKHGLIQQPARPKSPAPTRNPKLRASAS